MTKPLHNIRENFIQQFLFVLIGVFTYLYTRYGSDFAELKLKCQYLSFPVFIGEFLLFFCLLLTLIYYLKRPERFDRNVLVVLAAYVAWILIKTYSGYFLSGPMALRNAALFYYPLFSLVGYILLNPTFFSGLSRWMITAILLLNLYFVPIIDYFVPVYSLLALGFCWHLRRGWLRALGVALVAIQAVYSKFLFSGSRSHMIGVVVMMVFLLGYFLFGMLNIRRMIKVLATVLLVLIFSIGLTKFSDPNALKSMLTFQYAREQYQELDAEIQKQKKHYVMAPLKPQVYYQNHTDEMMDGLYRYAEFAEESWTHARKGDIAKVANSGSPESNAAVNANDKAVSAKNVVGNKGIVTQDISRNSSSETSVSGTMRSQNEIPREEHGEGVLDRASVVDAPVPLEHEKDHQQYRELDIAYNNIFFRIFIWRDMFADLRETTAWWGMSFGHPQRSMSIEILDWATTEWRRDGWITPHNSFLHMIYRGGIIGLFFVLAIIGTLTYLIRGFLKHRSVWGGLLIGCLMYWIGISNFLVFLELPYNAIPFWTFFGLTVAYYNFLEKGNSSHV